MPESIAGLHPVGIRWTIGDVSSRGWEALRLSICCAYRLFGEGACYAVCINSVPLSTGRERVGAVPAAVEWHAVTAGEIPDGLRHHLDPAMAEGVGWKLVPPQVFPSRHEIALDNDCILWALPSAMRSFLLDVNTTLLAEDVERCLGTFQDSSVPGAINSGIRGLPPGFPFAERLCAALVRKQQKQQALVLLHSELDEQGLQAAALHHNTQGLVVTKEEVSICSPFWPRQQQLGRCGAHFVGLNSKHIDWNYYDEPGAVVRRRHWDQHRPALYARAGLELTPALGINVD